MLWRLPRLLADTLKAGGEIHAALFELDDPQLLEALKAFGPKAHVILADGADAPGDENADARRALEQAGVDVLDRMVKQGHFAQWKFFDQFAKRHCSCRPGRLHSLQGVLDLWRIERVSSFPVDPIHARDASKERGKTPNVQRPISNSETALSVVS